MKAAKGQVRMESRRRGEWGRLWAILYSVVREGLIDKMMFDQRPGKDERMSRGHL